MKFRLRSTAAADLDVEDAFDWYQSESIGLGIEFLAELHAAYNRIELGPLSYQGLNLGIRRALLRRFPYAVYFIVEDELITVIAVMQATRDPSRWQRRGSYRVSE